MIKERTAVAVAAEQALDDALWARAETAPEAYLQQALRRLTAAVEGEWELVDQLDSEAATPIDLNRPCPCRSPVVVVQHDEVVWCRRCDGYVDREKLKRHLEAIGGAVSVKVELLELSSTASVVESSQGQAPQEGSDA